jgi:phosphatidylglycerophosphate synthase
MSPDVAILVEGEPGAELLGLTVLSRAILLFARTGAGRILLVGDPGKAADEGRRRAGVPVETVADLATARQVAAGPLLIASSAAVYEADRVRDLLDAPPSADTAVPSRAPASTPGERRLAEVALLRALVKPTDGWVSVHINRKLSLAVTRRLVSTGITPNMVTLISSAVGFLGVWLVFRSGWIGLVLGTSLVQLQSVLDGVDGEIARLRYLSSRLGEWLDNVLDDFVNLGFTVALGYTTARLRGEPLYGWLGLGAGVGMLLYNFFVYAQLIFIHHSGSPFRFRWWFQQPGEDVVSSLARTGCFARLAALARALARRDVFLFIFFVLVAARQPHVPVIWSAIMTAGYLALTLTHIAVVTARALRSSR